MHFLSRNDCVLVWGQFRPLLRTALVGINGRVGSSEAAVSALANSAPKRTVAKSPGPVVERTGGTRPKPVTRHTEAISCKRTLLISTGRLHRGMIRSYGRRDLSPSHANALNY